MTRKREEETVAERLRRRNRAITLRVLLERLPVLVGVVLVLGIAGLALVYQTGGTLRIGEGRKRTVAEQRELLASGNCALRRGDPLGRINGVLTPTKAIPERRWQVEEIARKRVLQVFASEVTVVPCSSIQIEP